MVVSMEQTSDVLAAVRLARLGFELEAVEEGRIPRVLGSTLRSAFGAALRGVCCPPEWQQASCEACPQEAHCTWRYLFRTRRPDEAARLRSLTDIPRPLVLRPWEAPTGYLRRGQALGLEMVLVGRAVRFWPHLLVAVGRMAAAGLGRDRLPLRLRRCQQLAPGAGFGEERGQGGRAAGEGGDPGGSERGRLLWLEGEARGAPRAECLGATSVGASTERVTVEFVSPTQLVSNSRSQSRPGFDVLARALLRRVSSLAYFYCDTELELDYRGFKERAATVRLVKSELQPYHHELPRAKGRKTVPLQGVVGKAHYAGEALPQFAPLLALGEHLHVGKKTLYGMGQYRIVG